MASISIQRFGLLFLLVFSLNLVAVQAQGDGDNPSVLDIFYDSVVEETLTPNAFYDWWTIRAEAGDNLVIDMVASGGLQPLIGILNPSGDLVARSEDGAPDATITLEYITPAAGQYTIVATRVGNADGTTSGAYTLRLRRANSPVISVNPYQDVTFRCKDEEYEVTTAATLTFGDDTSLPLNHRITVYGIDGFQPVIRVNFDAENAEPFELCNTDAQYTVGDTYTLPGEEARTVSTENISSASQLELGSAELMGPITLTIGSKDDAPGRYVVVIEGFSIEPKDDVDLVEVRVGPLAAKTSAITAYMVAAANSRLDPFMLREDSDQVCDDAGREGCSDVASFKGAGVTLNSGEGAVVTITGDRSDAGLRLFPGNPDPMALTLSSRGEDTHGAYVLILIGELPPRS